MTEIERDELLRGMRGDLSEHMRRTDLLENKVTSMDMTFKLSSIFAPAVTTISLAVLMWILDKHFYLIEKVTQILTIHNM